MPELAVDQLTRRISADGVFFDLFFREAGSRIPKELYWVGDGMQVWLQLLLHLFRLRGVPTVVLDEPDVYLHPDLQRRLVRLLEELDSQTITASHSSEVLAEAEPENVVWVERSRSSAVVAPGPELLESLSERIGTQFNLRLARALKTRVVMFVEGGDMKMLRYLAEAVGAEKLATESGIAVVPLRGFSNWDRVEPFQWLCDDLLEKSVKAHVILDRDYRDDLAVKAIETSLREIGVVPHIWHQKELESYLLIPAAIARLSGATEETVTRLLEEAVDGLEGKVFARFLEERIRTRASAAKHRVKVTEEATTEFARLWEEESKRLGLCPAKEVLAYVNGRLQEGGQTAVSFRQLARTLTDNEVPDELRRTLVAVEEDV